MIQNDRISLGENCIKISICERKYDQNEQGGKVLFGRPKHILRCLTDRGFRINRLGGAEFLPAYLTFQGISLFHTSSVFYVEVDTVFKGRTTLFYETRKINKRGILNKLKGGVVGKNSKNNVTFIRHLKVHMHHRYFYTVTLCVPNYHICCYISYHKL